VINFILSGPPSAVEVSSRAFQKFISCCGDGTWKLSDTTTSVVFVDISKGADDFDREVSADAYSPPVGENVGNLILDLRLRGGPVMLTVYP
jgi:hypothetical protein